jgi:hypothetical protein
MVVNSTSLPTVRRKTDAPLKPGIEYAAGKKLERTNAS